MTFFPEPKSFGSAHGWPAEGRPAGGGQRAPTRGRSLRAAERRRNRRSAAAANPFQKLIENVALSAK